MNRGEMIPTRGLFCLLIKVCLGGKGRKKGLELDCWSGRDSELEGGRDVGEQQLVTHLWA